MFHIYIYTPSEKNSNYIPHLIEHCVFGSINENNFFDSQNIFEGNSTYYSYYILDSTNKDDLENFIQKITQEIPNSLIDYEHKVLTKECENNNYNQKLIEKIGQKLYSKNYKYAKSSRKIYSDIKNYHQKYYKPDKIVVLENHTKYFSNKITSDINIIEKFNTKIGDSLDNIYIFSHEIIDLYIISILSDLFDKYVHFSLRHIDGEYNISSYETIYGDFEQHIFIAIRPEILDKIKNINTVFINNYIQYSLQNKIYLQDKDFDGSCMVKYSQTLSQKDKKFILSNIGTYYEKFISQI